ncbi:PHP domain-containing protein [bacterium]|nr:PHP domain-containing protein [bacterium]
MNLEQLLDDKYTKGYADLHLHTVYSDGEYTPQSIVQKALSEKFRAIAITDHDTVDGVASVIKEAGEKIEIIPGIELSAGVQKEDNTSEETHIVGLFIDYKNPEFLEILKGLSLGRKDRMNDMMKKLGEMGMPITMQEIEKFKTKDVVGRLHLAQAMVEKGYVKNTNEAFDKFIGDDKPAYANRSRLSSKRAISLIKEVGGIPIIAHPHLLKNDSIIAQLIEEGIEGIEIYFADNGTNPQSKYTEIAKKHNLLISGGSDCHGLTKGKILLGKVKVPYQVIEAMREFIRKR